MAKRKPAPTRGDDDDLFGDVGDPADLFADDAPGDLFGDDPAGDPLAEDDIPADPADSIEYPGTVDGDTKADLSAVQAAFVASARQQRDRMQTLDDSEFWACFVFETRAQKEAYLSARGLLGLGDKYLDGVLVARKEGVALPPSGLKPLPPRPDRKLNELTVPLDPTPPDADAADLWAGRLADLPDGARVLLAAKLLGVDPAAVRGLRDATPGPAGTNTGPG